MGFVVGLSPQQTFLPVWLVHDVNGHPNHSLLHGRPAGGGGGRGFYNITSIKIDNKTVQGALKQPFPLRETCTRETSTIKLFVLSGPQSPLRCLGVISARSFIFCFFWRWPDVTSICLPPPRFQGCSFQERRNFRFHEC